jgi:hypothetical protein
MNSPHRNLTILTWIIYLAIAASSLPVIWMWVHPASYGLFGDTGIMARYGGIEALVPWQRMAGFAVSALPQAFLVYALVMLLRILEPIKAGDWFARESEAACSRIGKAMLWYVLFQWLMDTFLVLVVTYTNEPGHRQLVISVSNHEVLGLVPALMAFVIAQLLRLARQQREELNEIV